MRIINCIQGSEEWEQLRKGKATASRFAEILTPKTLKLSKQSEAYAVELVAEMLSIESPPRLPSFDMERGLELEPLALEEFAAEYTSLEVQRVGFVMPDNSDRWGCSPDALVGDHSLLEIKCPKAETLIGYHVTGKIDEHYLAQIQGQLWITGREFCEFFAWHPELQPYCQLFKADPGYHAALEEALPKFIQRVDELAWSIKQLKREPLGLNFAGVDHE